MFSKGPCLEDLLTSLEHWKTVELLKDGAYREEFRFLGDIGTMALSFLCFFLTSRI